MNENDYDRILEDTGNKLGDLMEKCSPDEKKKLNAMLLQVVEFVDSAEKHGKCFDKTSLFAAAIISDPDLSEELREAAKAYIEADYAYVKFLTEKQPEEETTKDS